MTLTLVSICPPPNTEAIKRALCQPVLILAQALVLNAHKNSYPRSQSILRIQDMAISQEKTIFKDLLLNTKNFQEVSM